MANASGSGRTNFKGSEHALFLRHLVHGVTNAISREEHFCKSDTTERGVFSSLTK